MQKILKLIFNTYTFVFFAGLLLAVIVITPLFVNINKATVSNWYHADNLMWKFWWSVHSSDKVFQSSDLQNRFVVEQKLDPQGIMLVGSLLTRVFGEISAYNIILLLSFPLTTLCTFLLLSLWLKNSYLRLILSLSAAFVPYHMAHLYQLSLSQIWVFPLFFYFYFRYLQATTLKNVALVAILIVLTFFVDLYYFYFTGILYLCLLSSTLISNFKRYKSVLKLVAVSLALSVIFVPQYFYLKDSFSKLNTYDSPELKRDSLQLLYYSSRPWDYFLSHYSNPYYSSFSLKAYDSISKFHPELYTFNYRKGPETESFVGYTYIALALMSLFLLPWLTRVERGLVISLNSIWLFLMLLSMPPDIFLPFKIFGKDHFALLTDRLYSVLPFFRAYGRISIVSFFIFVVLSAISLNFLYVRLGRFKYLLIVILPLFLYFDFSFVEGPKLQFYPNEFDQILSSDNEKISIYSNRVGENIPVKISPTGEDIFRLRNYNHRLVTPTYLKVYDLQVPLSSQEKFSNVCGPFEPGHLEFLAKERVKYYFVAKSLTKTSGTCVFKELKKYQETENFNIYILSTNPT